MTAKEIVKILKGRTVVLVSIAGDGEITLALSNADMEEVSESFALDDVKVYTNVKLLFGRTQAQEFIGWGGCGLDFSDIGWSRIFVRYFEHRDYKDLTFTPDNLKMKPNTQCPNCGGYDFYEVSLEKVGLRVDVCPDMEGIDCADFTVSSRETLEVQLSVRCIDCETPVCIDEEKGVYIDG